MDNVVPIAEFGTVHVRAESWEHLTSHSGLIQRRYILRQQSDQRRQTRGERRRRSQRTATSLNDRSRFERSQNLFESERHTLTGFLQRVLNGLSPLSIVLLPNIFRIILLIPIVRNHRKQLLQLVAADTAKRQGQFESECISVTLYRSLPVVEQFPILLDDLFERVPIIRSIRVMLHIRLIGFWELNH